MICSECAWEADTQQSGESTAEEIAEFNDYDDHRVGHAACKGCDCKHYPAVLTGEGRVRQWKR